MDVGKVLTESARAGWNAYMANWQAFVPFALLAAMISFMLGIAGAVVGMGASIAYWNLAAFIGLAIIAAYVLAVVDFAVISMANENVQGRKASWIDSYTNNLVPAFVFGLFSAGVAAVFWGTIIAVALGGAVAGGLSLGTLASKGAESLSSGGTNNFILGILGGAGIAILLVGLPLIIIYAVLNFFIQFTAYEMAAGKAGLLESLRGSVALVRRYLFEVFVLGILFAFVMVAVAIPNFLFEFLSSAAADPGISALVEKSLGAMAAALLLEALKVPAVLYNYLVVIPIGSMILVKYWRIIRRTDSV